MKSKLILILILSFLLIASLFLGIKFFNKPSSNDLPAVFVGVDIAYNDLTAAKKLVDQVGSDVNLFVIGNTGITWNVTKANDICQYIYDKGLYFIYFTGPSNGMPNQGQWVDSARAKWGSHFLGLYMYDEWGGRQLDQNDAVVSLAANYTDAAAQFVTNVNSMYKLDQNVTHSGNLTKLTSDYALYWYDYDVGYDTILAEFGWNYSTQINVALCRGAATAHNRNWGVMITWTYTQPPYIESGDKLYNDMVLAYRNGAKYIIVFDTNESYTGEILQQQHFDAFKRFNEFMKNNPQSVESPNERIAYVLPKDYGYGFRGPLDRVWGLWETDKNLNDHYLAYNISVSVQSLLQEHNDKLDIIYDNGVLPVSAFGYSELFFWNGTQSFG